MKLTTALAAVAMVLSLAGAATGSVAVPNESELKLSNFSTLRWPWQKPHSPAPGAHSFTIEGTSVAGLYPGAQRSMAVRVRNPYHFDLSISRISGEVVKSSRRACPAHPGNLIAGSHDGRLPITVRARQSRDAGSIPIRMPASVTNECSGVTFTIRITGVATKVNK
ncbi:hypothetical protein SAMN05421812_113151 [Asanoa hainanensis]|uniref:Uncharacterized protein n=1 Tax=Asanoa hainanensis TaxID=560556 RepID=A0A239P4R3_9ACTN|nr:hypothetical protein [Asanoa hainanensis]SNT61628.1 hypothetical protein SAMN05421812_113151 [Asanoa hainanensis]